MAGRSKWQDGRRAWERLGYRTQDPMTGLKDLRLVRGLLGDKEAELVAWARRDGKSWAEIATALDVSRQAAWERWHDLDA